MDTGPDVETAAAAALRRSIETARRRLDEMASERRSALTSLQHWQGQHARQHALHAHALLDATRTLDHRLAEVIAVLRAEERASDASAP